MSGIIFTEEQENLIREAINWYYNSSEQIFQFAGNPGTGKTVVMNEIIKRLRLKPSQVAPMAYVGAAAINLRMKGLMTAKTIHSWLYEAEEVPVTDETGKTVVDTYFNKPVMKTIFKPRNLNEIDLLAIDEGSMVPYHMKRDILSKGKKILVCGDLDQLLPVKDNPAFLYEGKVHVLTKIMRQLEGSPIVYLCQRAKQGLPIHLGLYGNDVLVISEDEVIPEMVLNSGVLLCGKNDTRTRLNKFIRQNILGYNTATPNYGEKIICRKNNWDIESNGINLTNGLTGTVINQPDVAKYTGKSFVVDFIPDLNVNSIFKDIKVDYDFFTTESKEIKNNIKQYMTKYKDNLFEFGYAQTVHLAQGSQWLNGMYFEEYLHPDTNNRLHYTALSRFRNKCIYVKKPRKYL